MRALKNAIDAASGPRESDRHTIFLVRRSRIDPKPRPDFMRRAKLGPNTALGSNPGPRFARSRFQFRPRSTFLARSSLLVTVPVSSVLIFLDGGMILAPYVRKVNRREREGEAEIG